MKIIELNNLWVAYNKNEDFRVLVVASDLEEASDLTRGYANDAHLEGIWDVKELSEIEEELNKLHFDCDYVIQSQLRLKRGDKVKVKFKDLKIGDRFMTPDGREFIKMHNATVEYMNIGNGVIYNCFTPILCGYDYDTYKNVDGYKMSGVGDVLVDKADLEYR